MKGGYPWPFILAVTLVVIGLTSFLFVPLLESPRFPDPVTSAKNLGEIGDSLRQYASDNGGRYPDDFSTLYLNENIGADTFIFPGRTEIAADGDTRAEIAGNLALPEHCSYLYFGKGLSLPIDVERVIAMERMSDSDTEVHVLYGDGRVERVSRDEALAVMNNPMAMKEPSTRP